MNHVSVCLLLCQGSFTTLWGEQHKMTLFFHYGYSTPESNPFNFEAPIRIKTWHSFFEEKKQGELIFLVPRYGGWVIRATCRPMARTTIQKVEMGFLSWKRILRFRLLCYPHFLLHFRIHGGSTKLSILTFQQITKFYGGTVFL